jgi:hypothetical protein
MEKVVHPVYRVHRPRGGGGSPVHHGPRGGGTGSTPHRSGACIRLRARLLTVRAPRGKGAEGNLTVVGRWAAWEWSEASDELQRWLFALDNKRLRVGRDKGWSGGKWPRRRGLL